MFMNKSPWLEQLDQSRAVDELNQDIETDVLVVGGGIAGLATAYFLLKMTSKKVTMVEAFKIAHGATGHNAGQVIAYIEKPFHQMVKEYGNKLAVQAMDGLEGAWDLLEAIIKDCKLKTPLYKCNGYSGYTTEREVLEVLETSWLDDQAGLSKEQVLISEAASYARNIPEKYQKFFTLVAQKQINGLLDTFDGKYSAAGVMLKGCLNSALFVEELAGYLLKTHPERFKLYEHSPVSKIVLSKNNATALIKNYVILAQRVVLCTNGFENITLINLAGKNMDTKYHEGVYGVVGYMAGYKEPSGKPPGALAYFEGQYNQETPYFYLTRRPYENFKEGGANLVTIGGPETFLAEGSKYDKEHIYPEDAKQQIDKFVKNNLARDVREEIDYRFFWHGLMGYTKSGLRMIGPDPCNPVLLFNLGCNGMGIIPSIYGGKRIAQFILKKRLAPSVFDPYRSLC